MLAIILRSWLICVGVSAVVWSVSAFPVFRVEQPLADAAQSALSGERFGEAQLGQMKNVLSLAASARLRASGLTSVAIIELFLVENELREGRTSPPAMAKLQSDLSAALAAAPTNSFLWLVGDWLRRKDSEGSTGNFDLLAMSYRTAPNEAWIAAKRNYVALASFSSLPSALADQAVSEFGGIVRARLYDQAADVLAGPGWPIREKLLNSLADLDEEDRRGFARILTSRDIEGVQVPGVKELRQRGH